MPTNLEKLPICVKAYRAMSEIHWAEEENHVISGELTYSPESRELIKTLEELDSLESIVSSEKFILFENLRSSCAIGDTLKVSFAYPHNIMCRDLKAFLIDKDNKEKSPSNFFIASSNYLYSEDSSKSDEIEDYFAALSIIDILRQQADLIDNSKMFFLSKRKTEILLDYTATDIKDFGKLNGMKFFKDIMSSKIHKGEKQHILKLNLESILSVSETGNSIAELFREFETFYKKFSIDYEIFISEFSFKKIISESETKKSEFVKRLNDTIASIQGKILAIPVSLLLVASQIKNSPSEELQNTYVLIGAFFFLLFMCFSIKTQYLNLFAVKDEIGAAKNGLKKYSKDISVHFDEIFSDLDGLVKRNKRIILCVFTITWLGFGLTLYAYFSQTPNAWNMICDLFICFFL